MAQLHGENLKQAMDTLRAHKQAVSGPNEPPRSDRVIADSWRGLYGSDRFSSMRRGAIPRSFETAQFR